MLLMPRVPVIMGELDKGDTSDAAKAGLLQGDRIIKADSVQIDYIDQLGAYLANKTNQHVSLTVMRGDKPMTFNVAINSDGKAGIPPLTLEQYDSLGFYTLDIKKYPFFESFPAGVKLTFTKLGDYIAQFKLIFHPETGAYKGLGGFKAIGSAFPTQWGDWESFWSITAFLSIVLAFMNLLPIPALDGGHVLFTLIEMITKRKPSDKFL